MKKRDSFTIQYKIEFYHKMSNDCLQISFGLSHSGVKQFDTEKITNWPITN